MRQVNKNRVLAILILVLALLPAANAQDAVHGPWHSLFLEEGKVYSVGRGDYGQLGIGTAHRSSERVQVPGLSDIAQISVGAHHSLALAADGTVYGWGLNKNNQISDIDAEVHAKPVVIATGMQGAVINATATATVIYKDGQAHIQGYAPELTGENLSSIDRPHPRQAVELKMRELFGKPVQSESPVAPEVAAPENSVIASLIRSMEQLREQIMELERQLSQMRTASQSENLTIMDGPRITQTAHGLVVMLE